MKAKVTPPHATKANRWAFVMEYYYAWKNNSKRETLYKRACHVVARGRMNSCLIEFENGQREVVSRNAVKRLTKRAPDAGKAAAQMALFE